MTDAFDFTRTIERRGTRSLKWQRYEQQDVLPMWVADMDLASPPAVSACLAEANKRGVYGYGTVSPQLVQAFLGWCRQHYRWQVQEDWLVWLPGVVPGMHLAVEALLEKEDRLLVQTPVYPPIHRLAEMRGLQSLDVPLQQNPRESSGWSAQMAQLDDALQTGCRGLVLCNPQNPTGRVYTSQELEQLAQLATAHRLLVISDEIWADLTLDTRHPFTPFASVSEAAARCSITLMAPSKTFNIAGLSCAVAIIPDPDLRQRFQQHIRGLIPDLNYLGMLAAEAAWSQGSEWLLALRQHLNRNLDLLENWLQHYPLIGFQRPQATFVAWLDMRQLALTDPQQAFLKAGVAVSDGRDFAASPGWVRLNFGCPAAQLEAALNRMSQVLDRL